MLSLNGRTAYRHAREVSMIFNQAADSRSESIKRYKTECFESCQSAPCELGFIIGHPSVHDREQNHPTVAAAIRKTMTSIPQGLDQSRSTLTGFVDRGADGIGREQLRRYRAQQPFQRRPIIAFQPFIAASGFQDDRHAVVDLRHQLIGLAGEDGAAFDDLAILAILLA